MFIAFLVFAVEDYSKVPQIEELLKKECLGVVKTTTILLKPEASSRI
jgi:hypothetical protein